MLTRHTIPTLFAAMLPAAMLLAAALTVAMLLPASAAAQMNQGMRLQTGSWMQMPDDPGIAVPVFTAECWLSITSGGLLVTRDSPTGTPSDWQLWCDWSRRRLAFITAAGTPDAYFFTSDNSVQAGTWYHLALVVNGPAGEARLYVDGVLAISPTFSPRTFNTATGLCWGGYFNNSSGAYLNGRMDEARYWSRERSQAEIQAAMNAPLRPDDRSGLAGYWRFCGDFADSSGSSRHGQPMGAPGIVDLPDLPGFPCSPKAPLAPVVVPDRALSFCAGDSVVLTTEKPYASYRWSTGETTRSIVVRAGGVYTVTVTDSLGNSGTSIAVTVTVTASRRVDIGYDGLLVASGGARFLLPLRVTPPLPAGQAFRFSVGIGVDTAMLAYEGVASTAAGFWQQPFVVTDAGPVLTVSGELLPAGTASELCALRFAARATPDRPVPVGLRLLDASLRVVCDDTVRLLQPTVYIDGRCVGLIQRRQEGASLAVYPQPARSRVTIAVTIPRPQRARLALRNSLGDCVSVLADGPWEQGRRLLELDASRYPRGLYFILLSGGGGIRTVPLLLE